MQRTIKCELCLYGSKHLLSNQSLYDVNREVPEQTENPPQIQIYEVLIKLLIASLSFLRVSVLMFPSGFQIFSSVINFSINPNGT